MLSKLRRWIKVLVKTIQSLYGGDKTNIFKRSYIYDDCFPRVKSINELKRDVDEFNNRLREYYGKELGR